MTASRALRRASAVLVLLQRLCVCGASQRATPSKILHTPSNILRTVTLQNSEYPPILYVNLTCSAVDAMDTRSARPLPQDVVICGVEPPFFVKTWRGTQNIWGNFGGICRILDGVRRI